MRRVFGVLIGVASLISMTAAGLALGADSCADFAPAFAPLAERLGPAMGAPTGCPLTGLGGGDLVQMTSTGFAYLRAGEGVPMFTTGREFWALEPGGLEHWTGSAHMGFAPPGAAGSSDAPAAVAPPPGAVSYARLEAVTVTGFADAAVAVERAGQAYRLDADAACGLAAADGQTAFVRSPGAFGGPGSALIMPGLGECPVLAAEPR